MADTDPTPDPESPEWPITWAAKEVQRRHLGPKFDRRLPRWIATAIVSACGSRGGSSSNVRPICRTRRQVSDMQFADGLRVPANNAWLFTRCYEQQCSSILRRQPCTHRLCNDCFQFFDRCPTNFERPQSF